jgi:osmoprotectant transport system permease protein
VSLLAAGEGWLWWSWVVDHIARSPGHVTLSVIDSLQEHVVLTVLSVAIAQAIALPMAITAHRVPRVQTALLGLVGLIYTVPALALFAFLVPVTGLTRTTALIGLTAYNLLVLVRNDLTGLAGVPADVLDAADGLGMGRLRRLVRVELPLALPAIVAGLRVAIVSTIALVPITALIGQGGFGQFMNRGLQNLFKTPLVVGITCSILLALVADLLLVAAEWAVTPWSRSRGRS